jgi:uncharacterized protein YecE (DUF72 family)
MSFYLGCAVWSYKGWVGTLYPPGSRAGDFLGLYSRRFPTVEGNSTFYAVPGPDTVAKWAAETPEGFRFCSKMPKELTHNGPLQPSIPGALRFLERMRGLGDRLGPIFAQLPPGYSPEWIGDLTAFLEAWPRDEAPLALEVRHRDFFREPYAAELNELLHRLGVGRVLLDSRPIYDGPEDAVLAVERKKPRVPLQPVATAPFSLVRFISHPIREANQAFLDEWVIRVDRWLKQGTSIYFFVHCPLEEESPLNALHFQTLLDQRGVETGGLPWKALEPAAAGAGGQLKLF